MDTDILPFDPPITGGLVAGFDGSAAGVQVLAWALAEAAAHAEPLHVVRAWSVADTLDDVGAPFGVVPSSEECRAAVLTATSRSLNAARAAAGADGADGAGAAGGALAAPEVHLHAVHASPAAALEQASRRARLLVVGHRGHGRLQLVLGSVTEHLLCRASCPVVVLALRRAGRAAGPASRAGSAAP